VTLPERGAALAATICQSCHLFPEPTLLDKATWQNHTLPFMAKWLGMSKMNLNLRPGGQRVAEAGIFPDAPALAPGDWEAICQYFINAAPERPLPQPPRPRIQKPLPGFRVIGPEYRFQVPLTTLVEIDAANRRLFLGDALFGGVFAHVLGDLHRAEVRAAHGAEMHGLRAFLRQIRQPQLCVGGRRRCGGRGGAGGKPCPSPQSCALPARRAARRTQFRASLRIQRSRSTTFRPR
jgi:hypothetical protein